MHSITQSHLSGQKFALATFGLTKTALTVPNLGNVVTGAKNVGSQAMSWMRKAMPSAKDIKTGLIGDPSRVWREFQQGSLHKPGGALHETMVPQGKMDALFRFGLPAVGVVQALNAPEEQRGAAVGNAIGNVAGGFVGGPLGFLGQTGASLGLGALGQNVGSMFDQKQNAGPVGYY